MVLRGHSVQSAVIDAQLKFIVKLLDKENRRTERRCGRSDKSSPEVGINVVLKDSKFRLGKVV